MVEESFDFFSIQPPDLLFDTPILVCLSWHGLTMDDQDRCSHEQKQRYSFFHLVIPFLSEILETRCPSNEELSHPAGSC
jgi:hypothetical protein